MSRPLTGGEPDLSNVRPPEMSPMPGPAVGRPTAENAPCAGAALPSVSPNAADGRTELACASAVPVSPKYGIVRYFRNPEVRRAVLLFLAAAFLAGAGCSFYVGSGEGFRGGALAGVCAAGGCLRRFLYVKRGKARRASCPCAKCRTKRWISNGMFVKMRRFLKKPGFPQRK